METLTGAVVAERADGRGVARDRMLAALVTNARVGEADIASEQRWFTALVRWLIGRNTASWLSRGRRTVRLTWLAEVLDDPVNGPPVAARIRRVWSHASAVRFFAETGLSDRTSFLAEAARRIGNHILPQLDPQHDLLSLIERLDLRTIDADWIESLPAGLVAPWGRLLRPGTPSVRAAAQLVATRAAAVGLTRDILSMQPIEAELDSPFFRLALTVDVCVQTDEGDRDGWREAYAAWQRLADQCRQVLEAVDERLEARGVSTDLVFRRELLDAQLMRIDCLLALEAGVLDGQAFAVRLVRQAAEQRSVRMLTSVTLKRLARKVVEHTGQTGEHYLIRTPAEWWEAVRASAGGGALTAVTALLKYSISWLPLAPMELGVGLAANYAGSFLAMQGTHLTLASKQPAMTAAALAGAFEEGKGVDSEVSMIAAITRHQAVATVFNILAVVPVAVSIDLLWRLISGHSFLSPENAAHSVATLHPWRTLTIPFAMLTGVFLWLSSLAAGWTANWSAYRRLPQAVGASARIRRLLGDARAHRLAGVLDRQLGGIAGNLTIGFLLGFMPVVFAFMGLPIEVRHVTLSAASLSFALSEQLADGTLALGPALWAALGVLLIGACNFSVSFILAFRVAARARGLDARRRGAVWRAVWSAFRAHPGRFFLAPTGTRGAGAGSL